jgi:hypothetical protein
MFKPNYYYEYFNCYYLNNEKYSKGCSNKIFKTISVINNSKIGKRVRHHNLHDPIPKRQLTNNRDDNSVTSGGVNL